MKLSTQLVLGGVALTALAWLAWRARVADPRVPAETAAAPARFRGSASPPREPEPPAAGPAARASLAGPEAAAVPEALRVRVLDAADGAPLAHFALQVRGGAGASDAVVRSDADGAIALEARRFAPPLALLALDDERDPLDARQEARIEAAPPAGEVVELAFRAGPAYALACAEPPPPGVELELTLRPGLEPDLGFGPRTPLREGAPPWVRFDPDAARPAVLGTGPWTLTARDRAGFWLAWGEVRQIAGRQPEPVVLRGGARGVVEVAATLGGAPIESTLSTFLHRVVAGARERDWVRRLTLYPASRPGFPGSGGRGRIPCVEPGEYCLVIDAPSLPGRVVAVRVAAGEVSVVELDLELPAGLAPLEVVLRSQTGRAELAGLAIHARDPAGRARPHLARLLGTRADGAVRYLFEALPPGEWEIELGPAPELPPFESVRARAAAGGPPLEFLCLDADAPPSLRRRVRVLDAVSGAPLAAAGLRTFVGREAHRATRTDERGEAWIGPYPAGVPVEVHARAGGHVGALVELDLDSAAEDAEPFPIRLARGWGGLFEVHEYDGQRESRLAGVDVLLDGAHAATTDALGRALVSAERRPARVELVRAGYRVAHGDLDPATGALSAQEQYSFRITLRREP